MPEPETATEIATTTTHPDPHATSTRRTLKTLIGAATRQADRARGDGYLAAQWRLYLGELREAAKVYEGIGR